MTLIELMATTGATEANAIKYLDPLITTMERYWIKTPVQQAAFLATISVESARLSQVEEGLFYSKPERLVLIFPRLFSTVEEAAPYARNPLALSEKLYGGYHGRGLIQLTHKANYEACSRDLGVDFVNEPKLLITPEYAALSAGWFWDKNGCNQVAHDMTRVTRIVNGPARLHLKERQEQYEIALAELSKEA